MSEVGASLKEALGVIEVVGERTGARVEGSELVGGRLKALGGAGGEVTWILEWSLVSESLVEADLTSILARRGAGAEARAGKSLGEGGGSGRG
jgi:hypothetical protein